MTQTGQVVPPAKKAPRVSAACIACRSKVSPPFVLHRKMFTTISTFGVMPHSRFVVAVSPTVSSANMSNPGEVVAPNPNWQPFGTVPLLKRLNS
jgi:hypothetical protein